MQFKELTGRSTSHLTTIKTGELIHHDCLVDFLSLKQEAENSKIDLQIASSFRNYDYQLKIWNEKAQGLRPLLDKNEQVLNINQLSDEKKMWSILHWSALPGASRHHWGSDFDFYDGSQYIDGKVLKLIQSEYLPKKSENYDLTKFLLTKSDIFFCPYSKLSKGHQFEPWHYSHKAVSELFMEHYTIDIFIKNIELSPTLLLKKEILKNIEEIFNRYIKI